MQGLPMNSQTTAKLTPPFDRLISMRKQSFPFSFGDRIPMHHLATSLLAAAVIGIGACSEPEEADLKPIIPNPIDTTDTAKADNRKIAYGTMLVSLVAPDSSTPGSETPGFTSVAGRFYDSISPSPVKWELKATVGACKLYTPKSVFCPTACGSSAACVDNNVCQPYPKSLVVGKITVNGLKTKTGETSFTMDPLLGNYQPIGKTIDYPPAAEGTEFSFAAAGDSVALPFTLAGKGIKPLKVLNDTITLNDGQPIALTWVAAASPSASSIKVMVDISHHGGVKGKVECETTDNGSLTIDAGLLSQLKALGVAGFPKIDIVRRAVSGHDKVKAELIIESAVTKSLEIPGLISCSDDENCPDGQTCQLDMRCQ